MEVSTSLGYLGSSDWNRFFLPEEKKYIITKSIKWFSLFLI